MFKDDWVFVIHEIGNTPRVNMGYIQSIGETTITVKIPDFGRTTLTVTVPTEQVFDSGREAKEAYDLLTV